MVVPYGDPRSPHFRKCAFDAGEDGLGRNATSLELGCDCLGAIHYFDAHLVDDDGSVETISKAICLHEEDSGEWSLCDLCGVLDIGCWFPVARVQPLNWQRCEQAPCGSTRTGATERQKCGGHAGWWCRLSAQSRTTRCVAMMVEPPG